VISWSESRARSASRVSASARSCALSAARAAKSARTAARTRSPRSKGRSRSRQSVAISRLRARSGILAACPFPSGAFSPGGSRFPRAPKSSSASRRACYRTRAGARGAVLVDDGFAEGNRDRVRARVRLELGEDVAHVALHGFLADEETPGHVRVRHSVGEQLEDLALARGQHVVLVLAGQEGRHQRRVDVAVAGRHLLDRAQERLVWRLLEDVALRAGLEPAAEERALAVGRDD